jgi:hypothetical protein
MYISTTMPNNIFAYIYITLSYMLLLYIHYIVYDYQHYDAHGVDGIPAVADGPLVGIGRGWLLSC